MIFTDCLESFLDNVVCGVVEGFLMILDLLKRLAPYLQNTWKRAFTVVIPIIVLMTFTYDRHPLYAEGKIDEVPNFEEVPPTTDAEEFARKSQECQKQYASFVRDANVTYCNATFDQFLCWPPTEAGTNVTKYCPAEVPFVDPKSLAVRFCGNDGLWLDQNMENSPTGWTDYINCFPLYVRELLENMTKSKDPDAKFTVAGWIRSIEFLGISLSILALILGIIIFKKFRTLLNKRTKIHLHLFSVLLCQCVVLLSIYVDQETSRLMAKNDTGCKVMYTVVEFLTTHCFCFMLIEGLYLHSTINANALRPQLSYRMCLAFAYLWPILNTSVWVGIAISRYELEEKVRCWFGYNLDKIFWILQGPRLAIIIINFLLLLAVLRILMTKMSQNRTTDSERVKKALRATMLLMPLLGITNFLSMTNGPVRDSTLKFALWALFAYVFRSFQGFLIVYIYCFRNAEVHEVLKNYMRSKRDARNYSVRGRTNVTETECEVFRRDGELSRMASLIPDADMLAPADATLILARRCSSEGSDSDKDAEEIELTTFPKVTVVEAITHCEEYDDSPADIEETEAQT